MSYGLRHELFFSDTEQRRFKVEIHKKNYVGDVSELVGTGNPVEIEWNSDDDIYSPIIGSRCKLNLFVTDSTSYEDFHDADEREYLMRILIATNDAGLISWENKDSDWNLAESNWDANDGEDEYFISIWEGFIVVDRFTEQMIHKPYPISIEAIDGLGTLEGFDNPINIEDTSTTENLFWYLKEILKLTGHNHNIYIANDIRKVGGNANDTIFHDIVVDEYALFTSKLISRNAKDVLKEILEITNSRIYLSNGAWYVVNNSSLIDKNIDQLTIAPSGDDTSIEPVEQDPFTDVDSPNVVINGDVATVTATQDGIFNLWGTNAGGEIETFTWSFSDSTPDIDGTGNNPTAQFTASSSLDGVTVTLTATNSSGSDSDTITLDVVDPVTPDPQDVGGTLTINVSNYVDFATITPLQAIKTFDAGEVGDAFTYQFKVTPNAGYAFTDVGGVTSILSSAGYTIQNKTLSNGVITFEVAGTLPSGGRTSTLEVFGTPLQRKYTLTLNLINNITNSNVPSGANQKVFTNTGGSSYDWEFYITPNSGFYFDDISRYSAPVTSGVSPSTKVLIKDNNNQIRLKVAGKLPFENSTINFTAQGDAVSDGGATAFASNMSMVSSVEMYWNQSLPFATYLFIRKNGSALSRFDTSRKDLFNGSYYIVITYTSGGNWLKLRRSINGYSATATGNFITNASPPATFAKDDFSFILTPDIYNYNNYGSSPWVAVVEFKGATTNQTLHTMTITKKGRSQY